MGIELGDFKFLLTMIDCDHGVMDCGNAYLAVGIDR